MGAAPRTAPLTWPTTRVREAETLAQAVLGGRVSVDRLCSLVADLQRDLDVDHAQVSIISDRQIAVVVDGRLGSLEGDADTDAPTVSPLENTLCVIAMRADSTVAINDAVADERTVSTPPVERGRIGSYLGSPIRTQAAQAAQAAQVSQVSQSKSGHSHAPTRVGVLCVYRADAHVWTPSEGEALDRAAAAVGEELQAIRDAVGRLVHHEQPAAPA